MALLRERGFLLLWIGQFLNIIATWSLRVVLLIWVYTLTGSGVAVSLVGLAEAAPLLLLGPIAGVYVDRWNRSYTMAGASIATAVLILPLLAVSTSRGMPVVVGVAVLANSFGQLFMTAGSAAVPVVVGQERAGQANSLLSLLNGIIAVTGPGAAAFIFATVGPHGAVIAFSALFVLAAPVLIFVPAPRAVSSGAVGTTVLREMIDGVRYVRRSSLLTTLVILAFVALLGIGALSVLDVVFVTRALHLPSTRVGVLFTVSGAGELSGGITMALIGARVARRYHQLLGWSIIISALAFVVYAVSPNLWVASGALAIVGVTFPPLIVSFMTMVQIVSEDVYMGRVNSVINTAIAVAMILSLVSCGALVDLFGVRQIIAAAAIMFGISGALSLYFIRSTPEPRVAPEIPCITTPNVEGNAIRVQPVPAGAGNERLGLP
jgi:MFS family permease